MAAPPLGKCIVLPLFLLLFYVGYGFRIRDVGQAVSIEHGECPLGVGKCPGDTGGQQVTFSSLKKRVESVGGTRGRIASGGARQPPVEVEQDSGEEEGEGEAVAEHGRSRSSGFSKRATPEGREFVQKEDEDEEDGVVEEDESDETEEVTIDEDDEKDNESDENSKKKETVKRDIKWSFRGTSKIEEADNHQNDNVKASAINKLVDGKRVPKKSEEELKDDGKGESREGRNQDESPKGEDENESEEDFSVEEEKKKEEKPIRKLEKVRLADKTRPKPTEAPAVKAMKEELKVKDDPKSEKVELKVEEEKPIPAKPVPPKEEKIAKKEIVDKIEKVTKKEENPVKESAPKKEEKKPVTTEKEKPKEKEKDKVKEKSKKKSKEPEKVKETKEKEKSKEKPKEKPKENIADKKPKAEVTVKKESEANKKKPDQSKKHQEGSISLSELNDIILHVPNFVPNFTAVEDPVCQQHGKIFLRQLRGRKLWALQMLDSSGKIPSGLLRGNVNQLGDFDQCLGISSKIRLDDKQTLQIQGKYCLASVDIQATTAETKVPVNLI